MMKNQAVNPFLPLDEYVPDGEPHVFGDRVYLYGSHDKECGDRFCMLDYTVWSAPVDNLSDWKCHGVSYKKSQDKRNTTNKPVDYYAPDCVKGNDGRYYLYYAAMGPNVKHFGPMSVAVSGKPEGPFEYFDDIHYKDGTPVTMYLTNDPAVLNDNGKIWLYYGWGLGRDFRSKLFSPVLNIVQSKLFDRPIEEIKNTEPSILSCAVVEMENDMVTVKTTPKAVLDSKTTADKNSPLYKHPFYEAPSIRKFGNLYYLVYSCGKDNALAYATSKFPDRDFVYRGIIISNSDLGLNGNKVPKNNSGTIHGGIEKINGRYYVFYHRCTNNTDFSRQACAEPIEIESDGRIKQSGVTSCGLNGAPLKAEGLYSAAICCQLYNTRLKCKIGNGNTDKYPCVTFDGQNRFVKGATAGTVIAYKYFEFTGENDIVITARGNGTLLIDDNIVTVADSYWQKFPCKLHHTGTAELSIEVLKGKIDLLEFEFIPTKH